MHGHKIVNQNALHFITMTIVGWIDVFTRDIYKKIVIDSLVFCQKEKGLIINAYVIMSNHIHLICYTREPNNLSDTLRDFKKFTSKAIINAIDQSNPAESRKEWMLRLFEYYAKYNKNNETYQFWQQDNHPVELASPKWINQKLAYIHLNPVRAGWVENAEEYLYSSAKAYLDQESLIEIEKLELNNTIGFIDS
ncbi:MAG: transposase [Saprospiraceae bacterium]|nr:transposase [Saprospiraceae bacterium]MBK7811087.1 transposase [Saprospiraceae bacterium]MBK9630683.1 transposase [Saprospiraceae bacterium]